MSRNVRCPHYKSSHSTASGRSVRSSHSYDTAPTEYSGRRRPPFIQEEMGYAHVQGQGQGQDYFAPKHDSEQYEPLPHRCSIDTYASTSDEEFADDLDDVVEYHVPHYQHEPTLTDAIPTTPYDFGQLFPTAKRISIRHDDATIDGNMNLRVDTHVEDQYHSKQSYTLFHLRMQDLRTRNLSLRRYCRDSGREVCHSIRKYQTPPPEKRPALQRASSALASLVKSDSRTMTPRLKRSDSGYESVRGAFDDDRSADVAEPCAKGAGFSKGKALIPTNTIQLEFSNYAHLDIKRQGGKANKRYGFEYWGDHYSWKRIVKKENEREQESVSYYLVKDANDKEPLAHICPIQLTPKEAREEAARGGWVSPCYMRITDEHILTSDSDISDVVVATGLMALVDDCIKRRFHSKQHTQLHIPLLRNSSFKMNMEYIGPKRLIDEVFHRRTHDHGNQGRLPALRHGLMEV